MTLHAAWSTTPDRRIAAPGPPRPGANRRRPMLRSLTGVAVAGLLLDGCQVSELAHEGAHHLAPVPASLERRIERLGMDTRSPILLRIFKEESTLEVWKEDRSGRFQRLKEYEICAWSGKLGPKLKEGDRQAPEGFYTVSPAQMNPNSSYHLAFNIGFPNAFDRSHGRTGSHLMVHGDCSSRGCYAMEDAPIQEIYALAREAFRGGQQAFQVQAFPFRMTPENMARHADSEHFAFWEMLKRGSDHFEVTGRPPRVDVCGRSYVFDAVPESGSFSPRGTCPAYDVPDDVERLVAKKWQSDLDRQQTLIARAAATEERQAQWAEREAAIAAFFDPSGEDGAGDGDSGARAPAAAASSGRPAAGVPVPRPSPVARTAVASSDRDGGFGLRIPNPFARRDAPVASTAGIAADAPSPEPVPEVAAASGRDSGRGDDGVTPTEPLGYAPSGDGDGGFLSGIARGSRNIFRAAGSIFE